MGKGTTTFGEWPTVDGLYMLTYTDRPWKVAKWLCSKRKFYDVNREIKTLTELPTPQTWDSSFFESKKEQKNGRNDLRDNSMGNSNYN